MNTNLVVKVANLLRKDSGSQAGASIHLEKVIPYAAGLGGGSSDAAVTLRSLSELWGLTTTDDELRALGARLGSDVPFFISAAPAIASGRGEVLTELDQDQMPLGLHVLIVVAAVSISTAEAYASITPSAGERPSIGEIVTSTNVGEWQGLLVNDFQEAAFEKPSRTGEDI